MVPVVVPVVATVLIALGSTGVGWALAGALGIGVRTTLRDLIRAEHDLREQKREPLQVQRFIPHVAGAVGSAVLALLFFGPEPPLLAICGTIGAVAVPAVYRTLIVERERTRIAGLLPEALGTLSATLRAGQNLPQAVDEAAGRTPPPLGDLLREASQRLAGGEDLVAVFETLHHRASVPETGMILAAVRAHKTTGSNLAETFDTIADLARSRLAAQAEASASVSEQILVMGIMAALPSLVYWLIRTSDPHYFAPVLDEPLGVLKVAALAVVAPLAGVAVARTMLGGDHG